MVKTRIYLLSDPISNTVMYVGKTIQTLNQRFKGHIHCAKHNSTPRDIWIHNLLKNNLKPLISLIEDVGGEIWKEREVYWIEYYRKQNPNLTNISIGGNGPNGVKRKEETIVKLSEIKSKKIYQLDRDLNILNKFSSAKVASKVTNITHISKAAIDNTKRTAGGYIWVYEKDYDTFIKSNTKTNFILDRSSQYKKVKMYDKEHNLINEFESAKEAGEKTGIPYRMICSAANGFKRSCKGFIWRYEEDYEYKRKL